MNNTLSDLADLRCWPADKDIAEVEGELLQELDEIEYEASEVLKAQRKRPFEGASSQGYYPWRGYLLLSSVFKYTKL